MSTTVRLAKLKNIFPNIYFTEKYMQISINNYIIFIITIKPLLDDNIDVSDKNWQKHDDFYLYNSRITVVKIETIENLKEDLKGEITELSKRHNVPICDKIVEFFDNYRTTKNGCVFINEQFVNQIDKIQSSIFEYTNNVDDILRRPIYKCNCEYDCDCNEDKPFMDDKYDSVKCRFSAIYQINEDISVIFDEINYVMIPSFHQYCGIFWKIFKETFSHYNHIMYDSLQKHENEQKTSLMKYYALDLLTQISDYYMNYLQTI